MSLCQMISKLEGLLPGVASTNASSGTDAQMLARFEATWLNDTAATTTTALAERTFYRAKRKSRMVGLWLVCDVAVTGTASNYFTVTVRKRAATSYSTQVALSTFAADTATTDDCAAFTPKDIGPAVAAYAGTSTAYDFLLGDVATVEITKAGTGMTFPTAVVIAQFEPRD